MIRAMRFRLPQFPVVAFFFLSACGSPVEPSVPPPPVMPAPPPAVSQPEPEPTWDNLDRTGLQAYVEKQAAARIAELQPEVDLAQLPAWQKDPSKAPALSGRTVERLFDLVKVYTSAGRLDEAASTVRLIRARAKNRNSAFDGSLLLSMIARRQAGDDLQKQRNAVADVLRELPRARFGAATVVYQVFQKEEQLDARLEQTKGQLLSLETASLALTYGQLLPEVVRHRATFLAAVEAVKSENDAKPPEAEYAFSTVDLARAADAKPVVIGVWDLGTNPALFKKNLYVNPNEKLNGKDDDGNGQIDDISGLVSDGTAPNTALLYQPDPEVLKKYSPFLKGIMDLRAGMASTPDAQKVLDLLRSVTDVAAQEELEKNLDAVGEWAHGTHVAGIALAGHPKAKLVIFRSAWAGEARPYHHRGPTDEELEGERKNMLAVADFINRHKVRVINASLGFTTDYVEDELRFEKDKYSSDAQVRERAARIQSYRRESWKMVFEKCPDTLFVTSAGNSNHDVAEYGDIPADIQLPNVLPVGAVDRWGNWATFTNSNPERVRVFDHGVAVDSLVPSGEHVPLSGTSMASPNVANLAGKMFSLAPKLTPARIVQIIVDTGDPIAAPFNGSIANESKAIEMVRKERKAQK